MDFGIPCFTVNNQSSNALNVLPIARSTSNLATQP